MGLVSRLLVNAMPFPEWGGKVVAVSNKQQWDDLLGKAAASGHCVLVDCYARWCPPCRVAAPVFGRMSREYDQVCFAKINVDEVPALAKHLQIRAMPTFLLFGSPAAGCPHAMLLETCEGWSESRVRSLLETRGHVAQRREPDSDSDDDMGERGQLVVESSQASSGTSPKAC